MMDIAWLMAIDGKLSVVMNLEPGASSVESSLNFLGDVRTHDCFVALISKFLSYSFSCIWQVLIATVMFSFLNLSIAGLKDGSNETNLAGSFCLLKGN